MFLVRTKASEEGPWTETELLAPNEVEYPERRIVSVLETVDGNSVTQRPLRDPRPRKWFWLNLPMNNGTYTAHWEMLMTLDYRYRLWQSGQSPGLYPYIEIWEDGTHSDFERYEVDGVTKIWTRVKVIQVSRTVTPNYFPESVMEFRIADPNWIAF